MNVYCAASKLYNELLGIYLPEFCDFPDARKGRCVPNMIQLI